MAQSTVSAGQKSRTKRIVLYNAIGLAVIGAIALALWSRTWSDGPLSFSKEVLATMDSTNGSGWLQTAQWVSPPFAMRAKVRLHELADLRLRYGMGVVIFNWAEHPEEMRVHDPRNSKITPVRDKGLLSPNQSHELVWQITGSEMNVSVDGTVRFRALGNYRGIKGYPGIGPYQGPVVLESFILETPRPLPDAPAPTRARGPLAGDGLSSLVPEENVHVANELNGLALWDDGDSGNRLMTRQTFRPPFVIRARAKADAFDLRLYCGEGMVIFNWRNGPQELRVHDPLSGRQMPATGTGLISPNEWHDFAWEIQNTGMRLLVDGQLRFQNRGDYRALDARAGIGPALGRITVDHFVVEKNVLGWPWAGIFAGVGIFAALTALLTWRFCSRRRRKPGTVPG